MSDDRGDNAASGRERELHNAAISEKVADAALCGIVHLPSGRTCTLPGAHAGSCRFASHEEAVTAVEVPPSD